MSLSIIAAKINERGNFVPAFDFAFLRQYEDVEAEDLVPNPLYVQELDFNVNSSNAHYLFVDQLGLKIEEGLLDFITIDELLVKISRRLLATDLDDYSRRRFADLIELCAYGTKLGATHVYGA